MLIIPAIDIKNGKCVRLRQGKKDSETIFSNDPSEMAIRWEEEGAALIHIVDLDGAFNKSPQNLKAIEKILKTIKTPIQIGGGIRNIDTIKMLIEMGVKRVIIGTEAIKNTDIVIKYCRQFPDKIAIGIDAKNGLVSVEGWTEDTNILAVDLAKKFENSGASAIIFTDIIRDGMHTGPNIDATRELAKDVSIPIIASGGVSTIDHIKSIYELKKYGVTGIITGRALYENTLSLNEAIKITS